MPNIQRSLIRVKNPIGILGFVVAIGIKNIALSFKTYNSGNKSKISRLYLVNLNFEN